MMSIRYPPERESGHEQNPGGKNGQKTAQNLVR